MFYNALNSNPMSVCRGYVDFKVIWRSNVTAKIYREFQRFFWGAYWLQKFWKNPWLFLVKKCTSVNFFRILGATLRSEKNIHPSISIHPSTETNIHFFKNSYLRANSYLGAESFPRAVPCMWAESYWGRIVNDFSKILQEYVNRCDDLKNHIIF